MKDLGECLIYISENWVTYKSEDNKSVQEKLSIAVGYIIYFLHREIRSREGSIKEYLKHALGGIVSTIFVIVLKKYPKDHEHASTESASAKVISIVLNKLFEKEDKSLLFTRGDIEKHQSKDYQEIANYLTSDKCHDFFEESSKFKYVRREYCKKDYLDAVLKERQNYSKKLKDEQETWDYQEKTAFQEINNEILKRGKKFKIEEDISKKETTIWIDNRQRTVKGYLRKIYNSLFTWGGVWRNKHLFDKDPERVPVKMFNFVSKNLGRPILKNIWSQGL